MKRLTLVAVTVAFLGIVAASYAEVQQVRLSGELRIRGYWTQNMAGLDKRGFDWGEGDFVSDSDTYIAQRTRVTVEADLEDHVLVVLTLESQGTWGSSAAARGFFAGGRETYTEDLDDGATLWDSSHADTVNLVEAYVRFQELFWTPMTLTIGRQYLNFGNGLILSSKDKEWRFDAARFTWDQADKGFTFDFVAAKLAERSTTDDAGFPGAWAGNAYRDGDLFFANFRWEPKDIKFLKNMELYAGYRSNPSYPDGDGHQSDLYDYIVGVRGGMDGGDKAQGLNLWWEAAAQFGQGESFWGGPDNSNMNGWIIDLGASWKFDNIEWKPTGWIGWTLASGSETYSDANNRTFVPWFDYATRGGIVLKPILTNINIFAAGVNVSPRENWDLSATLYRYFNDRPWAGMVGNPYVDNGGVAKETNEMRSLGWELNLGATYHYSKDVKASLIFGWFMPGGAFDDYIWVDDGDGGFISTRERKADDAFMLRGEIMVNF